MDGPKDLQVEPELLAQLLQEGNATKATLAEGVVIPDYQLPQIQLLD